MKIEEIQDKIIECAKKRAKARGYELDEEVCTIHLMEELGELAAQIFNKKARPDKFDKENLKEEICDVILEALILAKVTDIDLTKRLNDKIEILNERLKKYDNYYE